MATETVENVAKFV